MTRKQRYLFKIGTLRGWVSSGKPYVTVEGWVSDHRDYERPLRMDLTPEDTRHLIARLSEELDRAEAGRRIPGELVDVSKLVPGEWRKAGLAAEWFLAEVDSNMHRHAAVMGAKVTLCGRDVLAPMGDGDPTCPACVRELDASEGEETP